MNQGTYSIHTHTSSRGVELRNNDNSIGFLSFYGWTNSNARVQLKLSTLDFKKDNFSGSSCKVYQNDVHIASIGFTFMGNVKIEFQGQNYILKNRGILNNRFELKHENGGKFFTLNPKFNWKKFSDDFEIEVADSFLNTEEIEQMLFFCIYGIFGKIPLSST